MSYARRAILRGMESSSEARDHAGIVGSSAPARRLAPKLAFVAVFGALSALSVAALVGQTPSALLHGGGDPSQISVDHVRAPTPDLIAGHTGWCVYQRQSGTGACAPVAPPLSIRAAESGHAACAFQPIHLRGLTAHWGEGGGRAPKAERTCGCVAQLRDQLVFDPGQRLARGDSAPRAQSERFGACAAEAHRATRPTRHVHLCRERSRNETDRQGVARGAGRNLAATIDSRSATTDHWQRTHVAPLPGGGLAEGA